MKDLVSRAAALFQEYIEPFHTRLPLKGWIWRHFHCTAEPHPSVLIIARGLCCSRGVCACACEPSLPTTLQACRVGSLNHDVGRCPSRLWSQGPWVGDRGEPCGPRAANLATAGIQCSPPGPSFRRPPRSWPSHPPLSVGTGRLSSPRRREVRGELGRDFFMP
jgi:hypothetical protein